MGGKLLVMGRKKLIFTAVMLIGVIMPLLVVSYNMPVEDVTGPADKMLTYESEKQSIKFSYPQGWLLRVEEDYSGKEVLESVSFWNSDKSAHGLVQVMQLTKTVPEYVQEARESMAPGFDSFNFKETSVGGKEGYLLSFKKGQGYARTISAEYFFPQNGKVYRFSCSYPEKMADQYSKVFTEMLDSFRF